MRTVKIGTEVAVLREGLETLIKIIKLNLRDSLTASDYDEMEDIINLLDGLDERQI